MTVLLELKIIAFIDFLKDIYKIVKK